MSQKVSSVKLFIRPGHIDQVMPGPLLFLKSRLCSADIHEAKDLAGICRDDLTVKGLCQLQGEGRFAHSCRSAYNREHRSLVNFSRHH